MKIAFVAQPFDGMVPPVRAGSLALWIYYMAQRLVARGHCATIVGNNGGRLRRRVFEVDKVNYVLTPTLADTCINKIRLRLAKFGGGPQATGSTYVHSGWYHSVFAHNAARAAAIDHADVVHIMNYSQFVPHIRQRNRAATIALHMQCEWLTQFPREVIQPRLQQVDLIIGCSEYITELVAERFPEFRTRCVTVPNAADLVPEGHLASPVGRRVLFVGRLSPEKGLHDLIAAFRIVLAQIPDASLHLVGSPGSVPLEYLVGLSDDPHVQALRIFYERQRPDGAGKDFYLEALEQIAGPETGRRIFFEGYADHHTIREHYRKAAVLVNPSLSESFGISLIEAMMMKLPVIGTRVGGMQHTVLEGQTGFLVDPANPKALAQAICNVLTDSGLAFRLGAAGHARAHKWYSWDSTADELLRAYAHARKHRTLQ